MSCLVLPDQHYRAWLATQRYRGREALSLRLLIRGSRLHEGEGNRSPRRWLPRASRSAWQAPRHHRPPPARPDRSIRGTLTTVAAARHKAADAYLSWRKGKIHGIRPVFRSVKSAQLQLLTNRVSVSTRRKVFQFQCHDIVALGGSLSFREGRDAQHATHFRANRQLARPYLLK